MTKLVIERVVNTVGKVGYHHFLFLPQCFQKPHLVLVIKTWACDKGLTLQYQTIKFQTGPK